MKKFSNKRTVKLPAFPIILAAGFVPLIVHEYTYRTGLSIFSWFPESFELQTDFFLFWKTIVTAVAGLFTVVFLFWKIIKKKEKLSLPGILFPLPIYAALVCLSALFSGYKEWVFLGMYEVMEPVWVLVAYVLLCFYAYQTVSEEAALMRTFRWICVGFSISALIGSFQAFGADLFKTRIGKMLYMAPSHWENMDAVNIVFGKTYMTVYNPDFVVFYAGIFFPILLALTLSEQKKWVKGMYTVFCVAALICLYGSGTASVPVALAGAAVFLLLIRLSHDRERFIIGTFSLLCCISVGMIFFLFSDSMQGVRTSVLGSKKISEGSGVRAVQTGNTVMFNRGGICTHFIYLPDFTQGKVNIYCIDSDGNEITCQRTEKETGWDVNIYADSGNGEYRVTPLYLDDELSICIKVDGYEWYFTKDENEEYLFYTPAGKKTALSPVASADLFNDDFMNGRGHIWNVTIPLLKRHLLLGSGANTYALEYPQDDYVYRASIGATGMLDVKPHCWYLKEWVENGFLALLCLLVFFFWYLLQSIHIYRKVDMKDDLNKVGFGILGGILVYFIAGLANDSTVNTAPVFWVMLGIGLAVNRMIMEKNFIFTKKIEK